MDGLHDNWEGGRERERARERRESFLTAVGCSIRSIGPI